MVTRPEQQADSLCSLIEQARGRPVRFPALEILPAADLRGARKSLDALRTADLAIFVSANAARFAFPLLPEVMPARMKIGAIGKATADALNDMGLTPDLVPEDSFDSEGFLALPELSRLDGKNVVLIRGNGGRDLLQNELVERGAELSIAETYQRLRPKRNPDNLIRNWDKLAQLVVATSNDVLDNLLAMLGDAGAELVRKTPLVVISRRMAEHAKAVGCQQVLVAENASDQHILEAICRWKSI